MKWTVAFHDEFEPEFDVLPVEVQDELLAEAGFVERFGPETGRPHVDTLNASNFANMKELRFEATNDEWHVAFAFDPSRTAILLVAGGHGRVPAWHTGSKPVNKCWQARRLEFVPKGGGLWTSSWNGLNVHSELLGLVSCVLGSIRFAEITLATNRRGIVHRRR